MNDNGQLLEILTDGHFPQGHYSVNWDASADGSGTYCYRLEIDNYQSVKKCILVR